MSGKPTKGDFEQLICQLYPKEDLRWDGGCGSIHITDEGTFEEGSYFVNTPECRIVLDFRYPKFKRTIVGFIGGNETKDSITPIENILIFGNHRIDYHPVGEDYKKAIELMGLKLSKSHINKGNISSLYAEYKPEEFGVLDLGYAIRAIQKMEKMAMGDDFYKQTEKDASRIDSRNDRAFRDSHRGDVSN